MNPQNEQFLSEMLYENEKRRLGGDLSDKQKERLVKTIRHYMNEVHQTFPGADTAASIRLKNKEVITAVVPDFTSYVRRSQVNTVQVQNNDESMRQDIAGMGDSMIRAMLALDARVDELEVALVSVAKRLPAAASAVRNDEQGKEL